MRWNFRRRTRSPSSMYVDTCLVVLPFQLLFPLLFCFCQSQTLMFPSLKHNGRRRVSASIITKESQVGLLFLIFFHIIISVERTHTVITIEEAKAMTFVLHFQIRKSISSLPPTQLLSLWTSVCYNLPVTPMHIIGPSSLQEKKKRELKKQASLGDGRCQSPTFSSESSCSVITRDRCSLDGR